MSQDPAFLFYPGDYLRDTQCLSEKAQVAYDRIMCEHMRNICIRQQQLNFFIKRLTEDEKEEIMMVLTEISGGFQISWVAESITKRRKYSESRRKNRSSKPKKDMLTHDSHMENENEIVNEDKKGIEIFPTFSDFWDLYDKKVGKKIKIEQSWNKIPHTEKINIMINIPKYIAAQPNKKFRKNPATYLYNDSWKDEIIIDNENKHHSNQGTATERNKASFDAIDTIYGKQPTI